MTEEILPPNLDGLVAALLEGAYDPAKLKRIEKVIGNATAYGQTVAAGAQMAASHTVLETAGVAAEAALEKSKKIVAWLMAHGVAHLLGVEVPPSAFDNPPKINEESVIGRAVGETVLGVLRPPSGSLEPGDAGAVRLMGALTNLAINGWIEGTILEEAISWVPTLGHAAEIGKLVGDLVQATGIDELGRLALRPLGLITVSTPLEWHANKTYRPTLLSAAAIAHQLASGRYTPEEAHEELARQGYSDKRIDAILNEGSKTFSAPDVDLLRRVNALSPSEALQELRNSGWDELQARDIFELERHKRHETMENEIASAAVTAYAEGRITAREFDDILPNDTLDADRIIDLQNLARLKRAMRKVQLSPAEAKACVLARIIPLSEYRDALERVGYVPDAIDALEMLLRLEIDAKTTAEKVRQQLAAEKAAAAQAKAITDAAKKAEAEAAAALKRQGSPAELAHAVIRGLIPISRLEQVLAATLDADTVAIYVADVEQQRQAYLDQQRKAADAAKRASTKGLSTGELQAALVGGVLTVDQVRQQLTRSGLDPNDIAVLVATMQQRAADHAAAVAAHDQAASRATNRPVDLSKAEALVRAGHWTFAQYNSLLASLGFTEAAVADLDVLLQDLIAKDQAAAELRAGVGQASPTKGLSLAQARSAVLTGATTLEQFQAYLLTAGYTADATAILVAELRDAVVAADAARARRASMPSPSDGRTVALTEVTKAARLGVITPAAYQAELVSRGYSPDDVALEMDLLLIELGATRAMQNLAPPAGAAAPSTGLTLAQIATAVKAGLSTIDDYRTRAVQLGYSSDDVQTLTNVLADEVNTLAFATARHTTIAGALTLQGVDIGPIEAAVQAGTATLDAYEAWILQVGYGAADAALLRALLASKL